ncbi:hypothetical protein F2Q68_00044326 [Brassica cretica]|uniref:Tubby C-terminal domain-containing protein n=2 Tax=Brassica cretica TaxID=69181 RepID=A0ABQ7AXI8_BRACR|nr:hypothetical protein F2Q68_00044326 [Brassica cretica]KAF3518885.1 hypothetical protein DY000_02060403 [Brassica cretica]
MKLTLQKPNIICHQNNHEQSDKKRRYNDSYMLGFRGEDHLYRISVFAAAAFDAAPPCNQGRETREQTRDGDEEMQQISLKLP